jgi:hypothetical protein
MQPLRRRINPETFVLSPTKLETPGKNAIACIYKSFATLKGIVRTQLPNLQQECFSKQTSAVN